MFLAMLLILRLGQGLTSCDMRPRPLLPTALPCSGGKPTYTAILYEMDAGFHDGDWLSFFWERK